MRCVMSRVVPTIFIATLLMVAGCTSSMDESPVVSSHSASQVSAAGLATYRSPELSFDYPADWRAKPFEGYFSSFESPFVYLSDQEMTGPCVTRSRSRTCRLFPIRLLDPGGFVLAWSSDGFPGWDFDKEPGRLISVDGHAAKIRIRNDCGHLTSDRSISVIVSRTDSSDNWYELDGCFHDPGGHAAIAKVMSLLQSVRVSDSSGTTLTPRLS